MPLMALDRHLLVAIVVLQWLYRSEINASGLFPSLKKAESRTDIACQRRLQSKRDSICHAGIVRTYVFTLHIDCGVAFTYSHLTYRMPSGSLLSLTKTLAFRGRRDMSS